jgi:hypothetical protein
MQDARLVNEIRLAGGQVALVDAEDYEWLSKFSWSLASRYAKRRAGKTSKLMHREIMNSPPGLDVDHINGDGLDNRRANLRLAGRGQNVANQKPKEGRYKGVSKNGKRYMARIKVHYKSRFLGLFDTPEEAAKMYDFAAKRYFGQFANLNFPE